MLADLTDQHADDSARVRGLRLLADDYAVIERLHDVLVREAVIAEFPELGRVVWHPLTLAERKAWYEQPKVQEMLGLLALWHVRLSTLVCPRGELERISRALDGVRALSGRSHVGERPT